MVNPTESPMEPLIEKLKLSGWKYFLEQKVLDEGEDSWGDVKEVWTEVKELSGIIQSYSEDPQTHRGQEEIADYNGFFVSDFELPFDETGNFRIKNTVTLESGGTFTRFFRIKTIHRNLILDNKRHHYELTLELQKKWVDE